MPRIIQTKTLNVALKGLNLLIVQNEIKSPNGIERMSVKINKTQVTEKPFSRLDVTCAKDISFSFYKNQPSRIDGSADVFINLIQSKVLFLIRTFQQGRLIVL